MSKEPVHELKEIDGKLIVLRIKYPQFEAEFDELNNDIINPVFVSALTDKEKKVLLKKAKAFVNSKLTMKAKLHR